MGYRSGLYADDHHAGDAETGVFGLFNVAGGEHDSVSRCEQVLFTVLHGDSHLTLDDVIVALVCHAQHLGAAAGEIEGHADGYLALGHNGEAVHIEMTGGRRADFVFAKLVDFHGGVSFINYSVS